MDRQKSKSRFYEKAILMLDFFKEFFEFLSERNEMNDMRNLLIGNTDEINNEKDKETNDLEGGD